MCCEGAPLIVRRALCMCICVCACGFSTDTAPCRNGGAPGSTCSVRLQMVIHNHDLDHWECSVVGRHEELPSVPSTFQVLPFSPLVPASVLAWATLGNGGNDIVPFISIPQEAMRVFPTRFLERFKPTAKQCKSIIAKRCALLRRHAGSDKMSRRAALRRLLTTPRRPRKVSESSDDDGACAASDEDGGLHGKRSGEAREQKPAKRRRTAQKQYVLACVWPPCINTYMHTYICMLVCMYILVWLCDYSWSYYEYLRFLT